MAQLHTCSELGRIQPASGSIEDRLVWVPRTARAEIDGRICMNPLVLTRTTDGMTDVLIPMCRVIGNRFAYAFLLTNLVCIESVDSVQKADEFLDKSEVEWFGLEFREDSDLHMLVRKGTPKNVDKIFHFEKARGESLRFKYSSIEAPTQAINDTSVHIGRAVMNRLLHGYTHSE